MKSSSSCESRVSILDSKIKIAWQRDNRIAREYIPIDPKSEHGMPCQAADILAYVHRQNISTIYDEGLKHCRILDIVVGRKAVTIGALEPFRKMGDDEFYSLIQDMRRARKEFDDQRKRLGLKKKSFYPAMDYPPVREMYKQWTMVNSALKRCRNSK